MNTKTYEYTYEQCEDEDKSVTTMIEDILDDPQLPELEEIIIGSWGECWEESCQPIIDGIIEHKEKFSHIKALFFGDMDFEECEVSWILQGNYEALFSALPNLKSLTIKGSVDLKLGHIHHEQLEELEIICGGLPCDVLKSIKEAYLPNLKKLNLYIGVEDYGFDGDISDVLSVLQNTSFQKLEYLGLGNSELQDEIVEGVMEAKWPKTLKTLDFSNGCLTDCGGECLLEHKERLETLELVDLTYHYLSDEMIQKLDSLSVEVIADDQQEKYIDNDGDVWIYPMLTE